MFLYDYFILFIIFVKISYYIFYILNFVLRVFNKDNTKLFKKLDNLQNIFNIIFNTSMAILLLYLFNPYKKTIVIDNSSKILLFLYSFILLLSNFSNYFNKDKVIYMIRKYLYDES